AREVQPDVRDRAAGGQSHAHAAGAGDLNHRSPLRLDGARSRGRKALNQGEGRDRQARLRVGVARVDDEGPLVYERGVLRGYGAERIGEIGEVAAPAAVHGDRVIEASLDQILA